jgi:protein HIRA/HIR1
MLTRTFSAPSEVTFFTGKQTQWLDYVPAAVTAVATTAHFNAASMQNGYVNVYSPTGRRYAHSSNETLVKNLIFGRLLPTFMLGSPLAHLCAAEWSLMAITSEGMLYSW